MQRRILCWLALLALVAPLRTAVAADPIDAAIRACELAVERDFTPVAAALDGWLRNRRSAALNDLQRLVMTVPADDRVYVAFHALRSNPGHAAARNVFTRLGVPAPFDDRGVAQAAFRLPSCRNSDLVATVSALDHPGFAAVAQALYEKVPSVKGFFKKTDAHLQRLKDELIAIARADGSGKQADVIYPLLAFYQPEAIEVKQYYQSKGRSIPRQKVWFNPVDRYLLEHELAGSDGMVTAKPARPGEKPKPTWPGAAHWTFPEHLRDVRIEGVLACNGPARWSITGDRSRGVALRMIDAKTMRLEPASGGGAGTDIALDVQLDQPTRVELEVHGRRTLARVAGAVVAELDLPTDQAYTRATVDGAGMVDVASLCVRYLAEPLDLLASGGAVAKPPVPSAPAAPAPWVAEREAQLARPVTFAVEETTLEDVAGILSRLAGVPVSLDAKAEMLRDLPVTLAANDTQLRTTLEMLARLTDIAAIPTEAGFTLTWNK
ncbi:MAG: hypothetical protein H0W72_00690 [Planctomycetes bacterium]|nr:hypothetical protein [Planctomycetota bacterium]